MEAGGAKKEASDESELGAQVECFNERDSDLVSEGKKDLMCSVLDRQVRCDCL